jgi:hypothetical protein
VSKIVTMNMRPSMTMSECVMLQVINNDCTDIPISIGIAVVLTGVIVR